MKFYLFEKDKSKTFNCFLQFRLDSTEKKIETFKISGKKKNEPDIQVPLKPNKPLRMQFQLALHKR